MKRLEYERLRQSILEGIGKDQLERLEEICKTRKMDYNQILEDFINNISSYVFYNLYKYRKLSDAYGPFLGAWLDEKKDRLYRSFKPNVLIFAKFSSRRGVLFSTSFYCLNIVMEHTILKDMKERKRLKKAENRDIKQQQKWAARQNRKK